MKDNFVIKNNDKKIGIKSLNFEMLEKKILDMGESKFRASQIYDWIYKKKVCSFQDMLNIKKEFREKLEKVFYFEKLYVEKKLVSSDGTVKFLLRTEDDEFIETVIMRYKYGNTICVSTQIGCRMGCKFCASTKAGFFRNLTAGEIIEEIMLSEKELGEKISNVVFMGIGEPFDNFDNFDNLIIAIDNINNPKGLEIGARKITVSTSGIAPKIKEFADLGINATLSISLHEVDDKKRSSLMPVNKMYNLDELLNAIKYYNDKTGRRVSFEYALINGKNDSLEVAEKLAELIKKYNIFAHVNLIPINKIEEENFSASTNDKIILFRDKLNEKGIVATIRRTLGKDIDAACGQLRKKRKDENPFKK